MARKFAGRVLDARAYSHGVHLDFIRPGTPTENGTIGSFNRKLRDERLNTEFSFRWKMSEKRLKDIGLRLNTLESAVCKETRTRSDPKT